MSRIDLIGAPTDIGASDLGASMGPEALRVAGIKQVILSQGYDCVDMGNLSGPVNPQAQKQDGYRHLKECAAWNTLVYQHVATSLKAQHIPLLLGGDHSLAIGSISAVTKHCREHKRKLLVLWLDAHADANTGEISLSGNLHGMPVSCLCGNGPEPLVSIGGYWLLPSEIRQLGIRSVDAQEKSHVNRLGIQIYDMRFLDENGMRVTMQKMLAGVTDDTHLHLSLDVDFLDPAIAPGVATTVLGGPTYREAQLCMEMIADCKQVDSIDIVEVNPAQDIKNQTAEVAVDLIGSLLGKRTLFST